MAVALAVAAGVPLMPTDSPAGSDSPLLPDVLAASLRTPSAGFVRNEGQLSNGDVVLYTPSGGLRAGFAAGAVLLVVPPGADGDALHSPADSEVARPAALVRLSFDDARAVAPAGRGELPHRSHFFLGNDPDNWVRGVRSYEEVVYEDLYEGIDLVYRLAPEGLKYEFHVDPGADPARIAMRYEGVTSVRLEASGGLTVETAAGDLQDERPVGSVLGTPVGCAFVSLGPDSVGVRCDTRELEDPLVIDPLLYSTYLGGPQSEYGFGVAVDAGGNIYVTGLVESENFPTTPGAYDRVHNRNTWDAFVSVFSPDGAGSADLVYSTFLGGFKDDVAHAIALDSVGDIYVTGYTQSYGPADQGFPTTAGAFDPSCGTDGTCNGTPPRSDAFLSKISPDGAGDADLVYSTYLGGSDYEEGFGIQVDASLNAYVTGWTSSADFPTSSGAYDTTHNGEKDAFAVVLDPAGNGASDLVYSTFLGDTDDDVAYGLALASSGVMFLAGYTDSQNFPIVGGTADQPERDAFVARLRPAGGGADDLEGSTYLGGSEGEIVYSIAVDGSDRPVVVGHTTSSDFPTTVGAFQPTYSGPPLAGDAFATRLNTYAKTRDYSTFVGGSLVDHAWGVSVDANGDVYVAGVTASTDFPTTPGAVDPTFNGNKDGFVTMLHLAGAGAHDLLSSTYLGGGNIDEVRSIALDAQRRPYVTGNTLSVDFPTTPGAYDESYNGAFDVFVGKLLLNARPFVNATASAPTVDEGSMFTVGGTFYDPDVGDVHTVVWDFGYRDDVRAMGPQELGTFHSLPGPGNYQVEDFSWVYGDDGVYDIVLSVSDDFGEIGTDTVQMQVDNVPPTLLNVTATLHENGPLTHGYWKTEQPCGPNPIGPEHPGIKQEWVDAIRAQSTVFTDIQVPADVCPYLDPPTPMTPLKNAKKQMMALWLNVVSGRLWIDSPLHHPDAPGDDTVRAFIEHAEAEILGSGDLIWVNKVATDINEDASCGNNPPPGCVDWEYVDPEVGEYRAHAFDPGTDDLTLVWRIDPGDGSPEYDVTRLHLNGAAPEPDYDPVANEVRTPGGTYPFNVVDVLVVGYPRGAGVGVDAHVRCLRDDDGGVSVAASDCDPPVPPFEWVTWSFTFSVTYRTISGGFIVADVATAFTFNDPEVVPIIVSPDFP